MYDPQIGRFWQVDPLSELSEDWSPYVFALDNPIYFNDPLGLDDSSASSQPYNPRHTPVQPPLCLSCQLPHPDPANTIGPPPSNVPPPIDNNANSVPWMDRIGFDIEKTHGISEKFDPTFTIGSDALKYARAPSNDPSSCPWCAAYGSITLHNAGFDNPRSASSAAWLKSKDLVKTGPYYGAIAIFQDYSGPSLKHRTGSGHIGFLYGIMRDGKYIILGGNQGDRLKFSAYPVTSGYIKEVNGYMHLQGFYFPMDYYGPRAIAPMYQSATKLNAYMGIISNSNTTR